MGNSASSGESDDEGRDDIQENDDPYSDAEGETSEKDSLPTTDLHGLFTDPAMLRSLASKIKEKMPENVIHQYYATIAKWLRDRQERMEEMVTLAQFCDMLMNKGASREEAVKAFQQFDTDGSGMCEVTTMLDAVTSQSGGLLLELGKNIRMLQACSLTPGFVDVFSGEKCPVPSHGERILKYLLRNRAESKSLPFPYLNGFNNTCNMRTSILKATFNALKEAVRSEREEHELGEGEEVRSITKCFASVEVSTNGADAHRLTNGDPNTYWQSDGAARSHWIRLNMKNNVVLKQLTISVASSDQSYMPELVIVSAGRSVGSLRELKEVRIASQTTGEVVLMKNLKVYYPYIQIDIKRCHSDGCDTRVHGIKTLGYRVVREPSVSVLDASALWYLQILTSTVTASIPFASGLRKTVLKHTRSALEHMPPLSLCPASGERPKFLSKHVLQEMETFLSDLTLCDDENLTEGLNLLLALNLARGHIAGILSTLKHLQARPGLLLPGSTNLLLKMLDARNMCWEKLGNPLALTMLGCDGGQNDEMSSPENVLTNTSTTTSSSSSSTHAYVSEEGKTLVNMFFKSSEYFILTKLRIKVQSGAKGAKRGLVFVFRDPGEFKMEEQVERFRNYDVWGHLEYLFSVKVRQAGVNGLPDHPVAAFNFDDDCDEIDIPVSWHPVGQCILIKFLGTRGESSTRLGVVSVRCYGFTRKAPYVDEKIKIVYPPNPEKRPDSSSAEISEWVLKFLVDLSQDQQTRKKQSQVPRPDYLDITSVDLETLWQLYTHYSTSQYDEWRECSILLLQLMHSLIPFITPSRQQSKDAAAELFKHLCDSIDDPQSSANSRLYRISQQLIVDGASLFFPDKDSKRQQLFSMMNHVENLTKAPSVSLVFQSLCQYFSSVDPRGLLDLPKVPKEDFDPSEVLEVMRTLVVVASQDVGMLSVEGGNKAPQLTHLLCLTGSLQTSLMAWCWAQLIDPNISDTLRAKAVATILQYSIHVSGKAAEALSTLNKKKADELEVLIKNMEPAFLSSVFPQLVLILSFLVSHLDSVTRVALLHNLLPIMAELLTMAGTLPSLFPRISHQEVETLHMEDIILRTWEVESPHNYDNNSHITQVFSCPGASKMTVDFDPRCETERRYDYLEFTDAKGVKTRFDQNVGSAKWPKQVTYSGPYLYFLFRSDSSNTDWGYKFKVTAKGSPDVPLHWPYDLQLSLTRLFGTLCGATLASNPVLLPSYTSVEETVEQDVLKSELWTTLFRGGYMVGKLQRSLSGKFATEMWDPQLLSFINNMSDGSADRATKLIEKCRQQKGRSLSVGGESVDLAIMAIFAALVWHTQNLREDLEKYLNNSGSDIPVPDGILQAYSTAESLRISLASQQQQASLEGNEVEPVALCRDKAKYLLRFAGLTKVQLKHEIRVKSSKHSMKKPGNRRQERPFVRSDLAEKYPSFRLVLEFVTDPAWNTERVHQMLQERLAYASAVADVYMFTAEFLRTVGSSDLFQIPIVLFFQEMFQHQEHFSPHYADGLDGCGLEHEAKVRNAYYVLVRRLVETFTHTRRHQMEERVAPAYDFLQACLLHHLDTQWQPYDLAFINEIKLPQLYVSIAKETVKMRDMTVSLQEEEEELREYTQCMQWFDECSRGFSAWYVPYSRKQDISKEEKKAIQMFVARFCDLLDVEINCDGCGVTVPGRRYRCLQCVDLDLCTNCYSGGVKPEGDHRDNHDIVHLVYKCNKCQAFIVGTRIHCNECEDFDLCLGCHTQGKFPKGHTADHDVTKIPLVKLRTSQDTDSLIQAYIHQHVWLLFTSLALSLGEFLQPDSALQDSDYLKLAAQLQNSCIELCTSCLEMVPSDADDGKSLLNQQKESSSTLSKRQEEAFASNSQERIMGLLGAMIPREAKEMVPGVTYNFTTASFLRLLFNIARGEGGHELNTQQLAMGLLGRLLARSTTKVADQAIPSPASPSKESVTDGEKTISSLFNFGASYLEKSGVDWACSIARILGALSSAPQWRPVVHNYISKSVQTLRQKPELSCIFAMFVMAGFPEVIIIGTVVQYYTHSNELKHGVVIKNFPDKSHALVVDVKTRKRHTVKEGNVICANTATEAWDMDYVAEFTGIITDTVARLRAGEEVSVENLWVLSLALKVLSNSLRQTDVQVAEELFAQDLIQCLVFVASKGTGFSQQWLVRDLEVLSLMMYTHEESTGSDKPKVSLKKESAAAAAAAAEKKKHDSDISDKDDDDIEDDKDDDDFMDDIDDTDDSWDTASNSSASDDFDDEDIEKEVFGEIDEKTKALFEGLHTTFGVPRHVLRVIYDMNEGTFEDVVKAIEDNAACQLFDKSDEIKAFLQKWEHKKSGDKSLVPSSEKIIDTGIHYHPSMNASKSMPKVAVREIVHAHQNLMESPYSERSEVSESRRNKSAELLKKEQKHGRQGSREYLAKVNLAVAVLYARQVLTRLLAHWPHTGHTISSELLGCREVQQIPCVLDLLYKTDSRDLFLKVVQKVIRHCDGTPSLVPIAYTACQFMEEVTLTAVTRESKHLTSKVKDIRETIQLPGASFLTVTFDNKCATCEEMDELTFSTHPEFEKDCHTFSGTNKSTWKSFQVPGDTLYYKYAGSGVSMQMWGYKFTVTAGTRDSFETGHTILECILNSDCARSLPVENLWSSLVYVACKQTGTQRLKAIQLLLMILKTQHIAPPSSTPALATCSEPALATASGGDLGPPTQVTASKSDSAAAVKGQTTPKDKGEGTPSGAENDVLKKEVETPGGAAGVTSASDVTLEVGDEGTDVDTGRSASRKLAIDLNLLRPLWLLYCEMTEAEDPESGILPSAIRALSELFVEVEHVVHEWGLEVEYLVAIADVKDIKKALTEGILNVACLSLELGLENTATECLAKGATAAKSSSSLSSSQSFTKKNL